MCQTQIMRGDLIRPTCACYVFGFHCLGSETHADAVSVLDDDAW